MATYIPHVNKLKENLVTDLSQWNEEEDASNIVLTFGPTGPCPGPLQTLPSSQGVLCDCTSPSGQHSGIGSPRILFLSNPEPTSRLVWILFCILFSQLLLPSSPSLDPRDQNFSPLPSISGTLLGASPQLSQRSILLLPLRNKSRRVRGWAMSHRFLYTGSSSPSPKL